MATPSANHEWIPQGFEDLSRRASTEVGAGAMSSVDKATLKAVKQRKKEQRHYLAEKRRAARAARGHDYTVGEEIANAITHGIGAGLAIAAIPIAVVTALNHGGGVSLLCALVYTIGMLCEYLISTLYHAIQPLGAKRGRVTQNASNIIPIRETAQTKRHSHKPPTSASVMRQ